MKVKHLGGPADQQEFPIPTACVTWSVGQHDWYVRLTSDTAQHVTRSVALSPPVSLVLRPDADSRE